MAPFFFGAHVHSAPLAGGTNIVLVSAVTPTSLGNADIVPVGMNDLPRRFQRYPEVTRRRSGRMDCEEVGHQNFTRYCGGQTALCRLTIKRCTIGSDGADAFIVTEITGTAACCQ